MEFLRYGLEKHNEMLLLNQASKEMTKSQFIKNNVKDKKKKSLIQFSNKVN